MIYPEEMSGGIAGAGDASAFGNLIILRMSGGPGIGGQADDGLLNVEWLDVEGGGLLAGGTAAAFRRLFSETMAGGSVGGGVADYFMLFIFRRRGGIEAGGQAQVDLSHNVEMLDGVQCGGESPVFGRVIEVTMKGGAAASGEASLFDRLITTTMKGGIQVGGDYTSSGNSYGQSMDGGVACDGHGVGSRFSITTVTMKSGIKLSGEAAAFGRLHTTTMKGGAIGGGQLFPDCTYTVEMTGGVEVGSPRQIYYDDMAGGICAGGVVGIPRSFVARGGVEVGDLTQPAITHYRFNGSWSFMWQIMNLVTRDLSFLWNIGKLTMYWYRIVGTGRQPDDCEPPPCCQQMVVNVHARTPGELCEKLSRMKFAAPIQSVERFAMPAFMGNAFEDYADQQAALDEYRATNGDCNPLIPVEICTVPECAAFCIDVDMVVDFTFDIFLRAQTADKEYVSGNGHAADRTVFVNGAADVSYTRNIPAYVVYGQGAVSISSDGANCWCNTVVMRGGMVSSGRASVPSSTWSYVGGEWPTTLGRNSPSIADSVNTLTEEGSPMTGYVPWVSPENAKTSDAAYTSAAVPYGGLTRFLVLRGFGFVLPENVSVVGIRASVQCFAARPQLKDVYVALVNGTEIISNNRAREADWPLVMTTRTYGSTGYDNRMPFTRLDRRSWTYNNDFLESPDFGIAIQVQDFGTQADAAAYIDSVDLEITCETTTGQRIRIGGPAYVSSSVRHYEATGGVVMKAADIRAKQGYWFETSGLGPGLSTGVEILGSYATKYSHVADGSITAEGEADCRPGFSQNFAQGGMAMGGMAEVAPYWEEPSGGMVLGGGYGAKYKHTAPGAFSVSGSGTVSPNLRYIPNDDNSFVFSGSSRPLASTYVYEGGGVVFIFGAATAFPGNLYVAPEVMTFDMFTSDLTATFAVDSNVPTATAITDILVECDCLRLPYRITLSHNFIRDNALAQFLARNRYATYDAVYLRYSQANNSWQTNMHYQGWSPEANVRERWDLVFELQCTQQLGGTNIGRSVWRTAVEVTRKNLMTGEDFDTRFMVVLLPEAICGINDDELSFKVTYDTQLDETTVSPNAMIYQTFLYDNIGLFKTPSWIANSDLVISVSQTGVTRKQQRVDLKKVVFV